MRSLTVSDELCVARCRITVKFMNTDQSPSNCEFHLTPRIEDTQKLHNKDSDKASDVISPPSIVKQVGLDKAHTDNLK